MVVSAAMAAAANIPGFVPAPFYLFSFLYIFLYNLTKALNTGMETTHSHLAD